LAFEPLEDRRLLANVTVGNLNDVVNGNVTSIADLIATPGADGISLREAIQAANADAAADTIDFSVTGTIQLTNVGHAGEIAITNHLTINGPGASVLTIRAFDPSATLGDGARIFNVNDFFSFTTKTVAISGLTLTGGDVANNEGGGAIRNAENLTVTNCTISGNRAGLTNVTFRGGGIANLSGNLTIIASTISGNTSTGSGGGIYSNLGSLTISQSTISGNAANLARGGGIETQSSTTTIDSSTISGNTAAGVGGGIYSSGAGITITNSTISDNSARASGGGVFASSGLTLRHSTITLNRSDSDNSGGETGGGVFVNSGTMDHTIVAGNLRSTSTRDDIAGTVAARYSLIGDNTGATITNNGGNQIGTVGSPIDPLLGLLAANGGPTRTHALLAGSPAIDTGDPIFSPPPANDQRGNPFSRIFGGRIDLGAFERQGRIVDTLVDEDDGNYTAGDLSLREAIGLVNSGDVAFESTISFADSLTSGGPATILLTMGELLITDTLTINGPGADLLTIDGNANSRIFNTSSAPAGTIVVFQYLTLTNGKAPILNFGGAIFVSGAAVTLIGCTITNCTAGSGGAVGTTGGSLTLQGCTITANSGGAIRFGGGATLLVEDSTLSGNTGGAIHFQGNAGSLSVVDSTISGNSTMLGGGGILVKNEEFGAPSPVMVIGSTISGNTSDIHGGGILISGFDLFVGEASLTLVDSTVSGNSAGGRGGGIYLESGYLRVEGSTISGNTAGEAGGGVFNLTGHSNQSGSVISSTIIDNTAGVNGGGLWASAGTFIDVGNNGTYKPFTITSSTISGNAADNHAGGAYLLGPCEITSSTITSNAAGIYGGGIYWHTPSDFGGVPRRITLTGSTIGDNEAGFAGGGIYTPDDVFIERFVDVQSSTIDGNRAGDRGGGIYLRRLRLQTTASTISGNEAGFAGGGVYLRDTLATLTSSTISDNVAREGGGVWHFDYEGQDTGTASLTISGTTISGNAATVRGGGVNNRRGVIAIEFSTVTQNDALAGQGSGIASRGDTLTRTDLRHTIVAENVSSDVDVISGATGTVNSFQSMGYNLVGTGNAAGSFNQTGDQAGVTNALLGPLAGNGGPTLTHALLEGSPAIDVGNPLAVGGVGGIPLYDQRGRPHSRVYDDDGVGGVRIDIGAFERQNPPVPQTFVVDTLIDEVNGDISPDNLSLREAIGLANGNIVQDVITFAPSLAGGTITLTLGELFITDSVTIDGLDAELLTIDASGNDPTPTIDDGNGSRVFNIDNPDDSLETLIDVEIIGLTLTGGDVVDPINLEGGGAIENFENLMVIDSVISGNSANSGGGIFSLGNLTLMGSTITGNSASSGSGGGIMEFGGTVTIVRSTIRDNTALGHGGGISHGDGQLAITESTISGNEAGGDGGGVYLGKTFATLTSSTISGNTAGQRGGGIFTFAAIQFLTSVIRHSTITNNSAPAGQGGGLASLGVDTSPTNVDSTIIAGNVGGDVHSFSGTNLFLSEGYNLIGTGNALGAFNQPGDQTGVDPLLGPMADNGGPTMTHALLAGSPAIDAGDPGFTGPPDYDQRGFAYNRVVGGRIDMGAFEFGAVSADFDEDGDVDGLDFLTWQRGFGIVSPDAIHEQGDADTDRDVDGADLSVWETQYGTIPVPLVAFSTASTSAEFAAVVPLEPVANVASLPKHSVSSADLIDLALAAHLANELIGTFDDTEVATPSLSFVDSSIEPVHWSDGATSSGLSTQASTALAAQEPSTTELSPWEDALDEAFASVFA
jgi:hypothetical protein